MGDQEEPDTLMIKKGKKMTQENEPTQIAEIRKQVGPPGGVATIESMRALFDYIDQLQRERDEAKQREQEQREREAGQGASPAARRTGTRSTTPP